MIAEKTTNTPEVFVGLCRRFGIFAGGFATKRRRKVNHRATLCEDGEQREFFARKRQKYHFVAMPSEKSLAKGVVLALGLALVSPVQARSHPFQTTTSAAVPNHTPSEERVVTYAWSDIWKSAVRYLRVERGFTLVEKDEAVGFVLFTYPLTAERRGNGSFELVAVKQGNHLLTKLVVRLNEGPLHLTFAVAEGMLAKLKQELGPPPPPNQAPPAAPPVAPPVAPEVPEPDDLPNDFDDPDQQKSR